MEVAFPPCVRPGRRPRRQPGARGLGGWALSLFLTETRLLWGKFWVERPIFIGNGPIIQSVGVGVLFVGDLQRDIPKHWSAPTRSLAAAGPGKRCNSRAKNCNRRIPYITNIPESVYLTVRPYNDVKHGS